MKEMKETSTYNLRTDEYNKLHTRLYHLSELRFLLAKNED
jgi:hypothetical protein